MTRNRDGGGPQPTCHAALQRIAPNALPRFSRLPNPLPVVVGCDNRISTVQSKLTRAVTSLVEQDDLVLESQFVAVVAVGSERLKDADN